MIVKYGCQKSTWTIHTELSKETSKHCVLQYLAASLQGTVFQEHIDKVLEFKTPVRLDDIIYVTNGTAGDHERELREILSKLQDARQRASEKKTELIKRKLTWLR